jgi:hypothetical protein
MITFNIPHTQSIMAGIAALYRCWEYIYIGHLAITHRRNFQILIKTRMSYGFITIGVAGLAIHHHLISTLLFFEKIAITEF